MRTITGTSTSHVFIAVSNAQSTTASAPKPAPVAASQRSPWHSPVPYLFGGLAAMLGLIAFALLILACSYWRLTGREEDRRDGQRRDLERGDSEKDESPGSAGKAVMVYEEKILVIMAGDENPTFLATPVCAKLVSAPSEGNETGERREKEAVERESSNEKVKVIIDHDQHHDFDHDCGENSHDEDSREQNQ